jgi:RimJ/RimL family protein N-acetyltransferase
MINIRPATVDDVLATKARDLADEHHPLVANSLAMSARALAGEKDGKVIMVAGIVQAWPGCAEVWASVSRELADMPIAAGRATARFLPALVDGLGLWRLQATCSTQNVTSLRWLEWLGFECEGLMRRYCPDGSDAFLMAQILNGGE